MGRVNYSGLIVAGIGFFVTRFTVTLAVYDEPVRFYVAGIVPLAIGLGLAAFGMALVVGDVEAATVRTTAVWCLLGTTAMLGLALLSLFGATTGPFSLDGSFYRSYLSNFLIGGSVGGTLTGLYASQNRAHRERLRQDSNRLVVLNRMLRHEVLNAITAIRGFASAEDAASEARSVIRERSTAIERTIEDVKYLTRRAGDSDLETVTVDLEACLSESLERVTEHHPAADPTIDGDASSLRVEADSQLADVFVHLLRNAIVHGSDEAPRILVSSSRTRVRVSVSDDGPGLPESQQRLLETGDVDEFDNPETGFGLNLVRLYVEEYGGRIDTTVSGRGSTITVELPRSRTDRGATAPTRADFTGVSPAAPHLAIAFGAALAAGVAYAAISELLGGSTAGIGVFYGTVDPVVGWITHEFHSVVFGFGFIGALSLLPEDLPHGYGFTTAVGVGWGFLVWLVAASVVAPVWLQLAGVAVPVPNFSTRLIVSHLGWGASLGALTVAGYRHVLPRIERRFARVK